MSTLKVNTIQNTSGVEVYTAKAWVNFNGTGTVAIRASGNVSSITDNGVGTYTVNFTTAMPDANYSSVFTAGADTGSSPRIGMLDTTTTPTTSLVRMRTVNGSGTAADVPYVNVAIFR